MGNLFFYTSYSMFFIFLYNSATNSLQFAYQILISNSDKGSAGAPDRTVLRLIAVLVLTAICLLQYFSARAGRTLNKVLAFLKLLLLGVVICAGLNRIAKNSDRHVPSESWGGEPVSPSSPAIAFYYVIFSFQGWENATFVS